MPKRSFVSLPIVLLLGTALFPGPSLPEPYHRFERLTPGTGTSAVVGFSSVCQDGEGYLWLGTSAGLARYDGIRFRFLGEAAGRATPADPPVVYPVTVARSGDIWAGTSGQGLLRLMKPSGALVNYRHDPGDGGSLSDDIVLAVQEDAKGRIWVGTRSGGLNVFDPASGVFRRFPLGPESDAVWDVLADSKGNVWAGTQEAGLFKIDPDTGATVNYRFMLDKPGSLGSNHVWTVFEDREGTVWVGTKNGGVNGYEPESDGFSLFTGGAFAPRDLAFETITAIEEDAAGRLWIGTANGGLRLWDRRSGAYFALKHDPRDAGSLGDDNVTSLFRDASGIMWVGTVRGGLNKCLSGRAKFEHYKHDPAAPGSLAGNIVRALWADGAGALWVGTEAGLGRFGAKPAEMIRPLSGPRSAQSGDGSVLAVQGDAKGRIWVGTKAEGLEEYDPKTGASVHHRFEPDDVNSLSHNRVNVLWIDRDMPAVLWVGTHHGLNRFDTRTRRWTRFMGDRGDPNSLGNNIVTALAEDASGTLWVGTRGGLSLLDKRSGRWRQYVSRIDDPPGSGLNDNIVNCIHLGGGGTAWIGTEKGINRFEPSRNSWTAITQKEGLSGDVVCGILEDRAGRLWVSTNHGLSRLDPVSGTIANFGVRDGLQGGSFNPGACCRDGSGRMYFGGANGLNVFNPESVRTDPFVPPVVWTALYRNMEEVRLPPAGAGGPRLGLTYKSGLATFEFAALDFAAPEMNLYAYRLEPRDADWIPLGNENTVSLADLGAGDFTLHVKAANPDGVWNEEGLAIGIRVLPPFWRTWWFGLIAGGFLLTGAASVLAMWRKMKSSLPALGGDMEGLIGTYDLTAREDEILRLVLGGASNKDIAGKLFISASTVRNHIYNIYQKLGVRNRLELISRVGRDARKRP